MRLEGFVVSAQEAARAADFIAGRIDLQEFVGSTAEDGSVGLSDSPGHIAVQS